MNEYKIGLNIDGVLLDTIGAYLTIFNRENNTKFTRYNIKDFYFHETLGVTKKVMLSYFKKIVDNITHVCYVVTSELGCKK